MDTWKHFTSHGFSTTHAPRPPRGQRALLTCEGDVEASVRVGVVGQELQSGHVAAGCYRRRQDVSRKGAEDRRFGLTRQKYVSQRGARTQEMKCGCNEAGEGCLDSAGGGGDGGQQPSAATIPFLHP